MPGDSIAHVRSFLDARLNSRGFRRKGLTWNRHEIETVQVIELQKSKGSERDRGSVTINIGLCVKYVDCIANEREGASFYQEVDCLVRRRIGWLLAGATKPLDLWWDYDVGTDFDELGRSLFTTIQDVGLPFLEANTSPRAILALLTASKDPFDRMPFSLISMRILECYCNRSYDPAPFVKLRLGFPAWSARVDAIMGELRNRLGSPDPL